MIGAVAAFVLMGSKKTSPADKVISSSATLSSWCDPAGISQKDAQALLPHIQILRPAYEALMSKTGGLERADIEGALFTMKVLERIASGELEVEPAANVIAPGAQQEFAARLAANQGSYAQ